jgi:hypothetical protein
VQVRLPAVANAALGASIFDLEVALSDRREVHVFRNNHPFITGLLAAFALVGSLLCCPSSLAQVNSARVSGTVLDSSGAAIPGAEITITNVATSITRDLKTNGAGLYNSPGLTAGNYTVKFSAKGFVSELQTNVSLDVGAELVLNANLKPGSTAEEVIVTGQPPDVDLTSSALSGVVEGKEVRQLPLNGRSWTDLAALTPGVTTIQTQPPVTASDRPKRGLGGQLSISGGRPQQNSYLLDGININDYSNAGPGSVLGGNLGVDAIAEFTVITTNPGAQYGRTSGGVISAVTRAGTNEIHGNAYEFVRNSALDARNYFDSTKPGFSRNQFGGSLGGPIQKNKTFIFGDYEGVRQDLGTSVVDTVPSAAARAGQLSTGNVTPDPAIAAFINAFYPLPNQQVNGDLGVYAFSGSQVTNEDYFIVKADHTFSAKDSTAVTYLFDNNPSIQDDEFRTKNILSKTRRQLVALSESHIFSASTINSVHVGYSRDNAGSPYSATALKPAATDTAFGFVPGDAAGQVQVPGITTFSGGLTSANPLLFRWNSFQGYDDLSRTVGRHSLIMGGSLEYIQDNQFSADTPGGYYQFNTLSDFITNQPFSLLATEPGTITPRHLRQKIYGVYFEDDFRFRPNLTLNLALRYEGATIPEEINGKLSNLRVLSGNTPFLGNPYLANPTHKNFEPRIGMAWDPWADGKTSVRAGFGIYDILPLIVEMGSGVDASFPFAQNVTGANLPAGSFPTQAYQIISSNPSDHRLYVLQYKPPRNYVMQWNLNVQREVAKNTTVMVAYVGTRGIHMYYQTDDGNIVLPVQHTSEGYFWPTPIGSGTVVDPSAGRTLWANWSSDAYFSGMETQLNERIGQSLSGQVSYTWSRCIDTSSGSAASDQYRNSLAATLYIDPRNHRGPCDTNITHNFVVSSVWDLPHPANVHGFVGGTTSGWQLSGIFHVTTGQPFTAVIGGDPLGLNSVVPFDYPDRLKTKGCSSLVNPGKQTNYIKLECFAFPNPQNRLGNGGRNELIGPGIVNLDFSIFKTFPLRKFSEKANVQVRMETYNVFNHADFSPPNDNNTLFDGSGNTVPLAGLLDQTTLTSRQIQFAAKLTF